jgi:hypothetical protein
MCCAGHECPSRLSHIPPFSMIGTTGHIHHADVEQVHSGGVVVSALSHRLGARLLGVFLFWISRSGATVGASVDRSKIRVSSLPLFFSSFFFLDFKQHRRRFCFEYLCVYVYQGPILCKLIVEFEDHKSDSAFRHLFARYAWLFVPIGCVTAC